MLYRILLGVALLTSLLLSGCSKNSSSSPAVSEPKNVNLGTIELTYNTPEKKDLGDGAVCILTAGQLDANSCELIAVLERGGKKVATSRVAPAALDKPMEISFGNVRVGLVLHIK
jgi:hypothetical protein